MKKTKLTKLIISLSLCLVMCVSVFAGCTLVTTDMSRYYSQVVASLEYESGEKIEITKRDLSVAVANYSETYQSYGLEGEEAVRQILESVINEKLVIRASENMAKEQKDQGERLETLEGRDGAMWRKVSGYVITTVLGAVVMFVLMQIGIR